MVRTLRRGVDAGSHVAWGGAESVGPPACGGVEDHVALGPVVNRSSVLTSVEGSGCALGGSGSDDFESGDGCGVSVPFPADDAGDAVTEIHAGVFVNPVVGKRANPVGAAGDWSGAMGAYQCVCVGRLMGEGGHCFELAGASRRAEHADALELGGGFVEGDFAAHGVS